MTMVVGSFETQSDAESAMDALQRQGFTDGDFSLVSHAEHPVGTEEDDDQRANTQVNYALIGGAAGAVLGGFLLGPIGAVIGGTLAGGGLAAALRPHGATEEEVAAYQRSLHEGRYVLFVRADTDELADAARRSLATSGAAQIHLDR